MKCFLTFTKKQNSTVNNIFLIAQSDVVDLETVLIIAGVIVTALTTAIGTLFKMHITQTTKASAKMDAQEVFQKEVLLEMVSDNAVLLSDSSTVLKECVSVLKESTKTIQAALNYLEKRDRK